MFESLILLELIFWVSGESALVSFFCEYPAFPAPFIEETVFSVGFPGGSAGKESTCNAGDLVRSLHWEDPLEEGMAAHSSILARRIPWTV